MVFFRDNNLWTEKNVVLISDGIKPIDSELLDRLKRRRWTVTQAMPTMEQAIAAISSPQCSMVMIDDSPELPAPWVFRNLLQLPITYMTPIIIFLEERNAKEKMALNSFFTLEIIDKPVVPSKFIDGFEWVIQRWSSGFMGHLRSAGSSFRLGEKKAAIKTLTEISADKEAAPTAAACLSLFFNSTSDFRTAEKVLISALRQAPRNLGLILNLVRLYLENAMPYLATRLLKTVTATYGYPKILCFDMIQSHLMLNDLNGCISYIKNMLDSLYMTEILKPCLMKILYAEGYRNEFEKMVASDPKIIEKFEKTWGKHELAQPPKAS
ncbi:MAG: tetratricopeptide repeat protein [Oligoflexales bacterium]